MYIVAKDIEVGTPKPKFQTEPTLPIYLKVIYILSKIGTFLASRI